MKINIKRSRKRDKGMMVVLARVNEMARDNEPTMLGRELAVCVVVDVLGWRG